MLHLNAALRVLLLLLVTCFGVLADRVSLVAVVRVLLAAFFSERSVYGEVFLVFFWALVDLVCVHLTALRAPVALVNLVRVLVATMACRLAFLIFVSLNLDHHLCIGTSCLGTVGLLLYE